MLLRDHAGYAGSTRQDEADLDRAKDREEQIFLERSRSVCANRSVQGGLSFTH